MSSKGGNNRRNWKHRDKDGDWRGENKKKLPYDKSRGILYDRPKWAAPRPSEEPIPVPDCPYCGKAIEDLSAALSDKGSGLAVHFDCALAKAAGGETLGPEETLAYIGGGRFGVIRFNSPQEGKRFTIKKILEWEDKENRAEWRGTIADHYSIT